MGDEVSTPRMFTRYCGKMSTPKMSTVAKCRLPKCLLSRLNPDGLHVFGKEISLIHKEFSRHFGILLKTLQPVLTVYMYEG